jgi:hypothetical protein
VYEVTAMLIKTFTGKYWNTDEKEPIALLAAINYFVLELNFLVAAVGSFSNKTIKIVSFIKR